MTLTFHACDYSNYRFEGALDWIEVRVSLPSPSQPQHVRQRIAELLPGWGTPPYVTAETDASSRTARSFVFRVQDPPGPAMFMDDIQKLRLPDDLPVLDTDIQIIGVEVAVDAYSHAQSEHELVVMAHHFQKHHARPPAGPMRVSGPYGFGEIVAGPADVQRALERGDTINAGERNADHRTRYYVKRHDSRPEGPYMQLETAEHRARMEVTLLRSEAPFTTVAGWRAFAFEDMTRRFALRKMQPSATPLGSLLQERASNIGKPDDESRRKGHKRLHKPATQADREATEKLRNALRGLTRRQAGKVARHSKPRVPQRVSS